MDGNFICKTFNGHNTSSFIKIHPDRKDKLLSLSRESQMNTQFHCQVITVMKNGTSAINRGKQ